MGHQMGSMKREILTNLGERGGRERPTASRYKVGGKRKIRMHAEEPTGSVLAQKFPHKIYA